MLRHFFLCSDVFWIEIFYFLDKLEFTLSLNYPILSDIRWKKSCCIKLCNLYINLTRKVGKNRVLREVRVYLIWSFAPFPMLQWSVTSEKVSQSSQTKGMGQEMKGRKGNIEIQQNLRQLMAILKIIHAAVSDTSSNEENVLIVVTGWITEWINEWITDGMHEREGDQVPGVLLVAVRLHSFMRRIYFILYSLLGSGNYLAWF